LVTFVQSDSTDARHVVSQAPFLADGIDVLYVDSLHQRQHVEREVAAWFSHVKQGGWIFFDDVDASPYRRGQRKDNRAAEYDIDLIHDFVTAFFNANQDTLRLSIHYGSNGLAAMQKLSALGAAPLAPAPIVRPQFAQSLRSRIALLGRLIGA
jgi:hypothetical protein